MEKKKSRGLEAVRDGALAIVMSGVLLLPLNACSSHSYESTTKETRVEAPETETVRYRYRVEQTEPVEETTTTIETKSESEGGILSIIGEIISLPFRALSSIL